MKSLTLRSSVALACALSLAGCGGSSGNLLLAGSISGLTKDGLVLQNNGETLVIAAGQTSFTFLTLLSNDQAFDVTVLSKPDSADCSVTNGKGTSGAYNVTSVIVSCVTHSYGLGGTITGLGDAKGLVVINGPDRQDIPPGATVFNMTRVFADDVTYASGKVAEGAPYGVTILTQPTGRTCTVQGGVGIMPAIKLPETELRSILITCKAS